MEDLANHQRAVELLQQLGLKEYEAKCFVALARLPKGTAKDISEISDVPRTRVYDAARVLEAKGLVEVQHSNPQLFRAIPIEEAAETLRKEYESRTAELVGAIGDIEPAADEDRQEVTHEVWALSGSDSIGNRAHKLIEDAENELVLIVGRDEVITDELLDSLRRARDVDVNVIVGTVNEEMRVRLREEVPDVELFVSELEWLNSVADSPTDHTAISRILLVDQNTILVSSVQEDADGEIEYERAVFGKGFGNGLVVIARRLMATGLNTVNGLAQTDD